MPLSMSGMWRKNKTRSAESPGTDLDELQTNPLLPPHSSSCTLGACAPVPQLCRGRGGGDDVQVLVVFKVHPHAMNLIDKAGDPRRLQGPPADSLAP